MKLITASLVLLMAFHQALTLLTLPTILPPIGDYANCTIKLLVPVLEGFDGVVCNENKLINCMMEKGLLPKLVDLLLSLSCPENSVESIVDELSYCLTLNCDNSTTTMGSTTA